MGLVGRAAHTLAQVAGPRAPARLGKVAAMARGRRASGRRRQEEAGDRSTEPPSASIPAGGLPGSEHGSSEATCRALLARSSPIAEPRAVLRCRPRVWADAVV